MTERLIEHTPVKTTGSSLGTEIAALRNSRRLSQREFGALVGMSLSTIALIEVGQRNPSAIAVTKICDFVGIPVISPERDKLLLKAAYLSIDKWKQTTKLPVFLKKISEPAPAPPRRLDYAVSTLIRNSHLTFEELGKRCGLF